MKRILFLLPAFFLSIPVARAESISVMKYLQSLKCKGRDVTYVSKQDLTLQKEDENFPGEAHPPMWIKWRYAVGVYFWVTDKYWLEDATFDTDTRVMTFAFGDPAYTLHYAGADKTAYLYEPDGRNHSRYVCQVKGDWSALNQLLQKKTNP